MVDKKISTTQLAKRAGVDARDLFERLSSGKWIRRDSDSQNSNRNANKSGSRDAGKRGWLLTAKGEFEGGEYFKSDKYGTYIVWPESLLEHPILKEVEPSSVSASSLAKKFGISARLVNQALAELGIIERGLSGWSITSKGQQLGGREKEHEKTGSTYVVWPEALEQNTLVVAVLSALGVEQHGDLGDAESKPCLDGHLWQSEARRVIDNWLYVNRIVHACNRIVDKPGDSLGSDVSEKPLRCDFYLPESGVYLEYWDKEQSAADLSLKLEKLDRYKALGANLIELEQNDLSDLDDILARKLLKFGTKVY